MILRYFSMFEKIKASKNYFKFIIFIVQKYCMISAGKKSYENLPT